MLTPGHRLDRYELLCPIASGGMATVWLARLRGKRGFEKLVAIKTIKTELITDPRYQEMFLDEARIASGIEHPNVAQILDLGEADDNLYLVMEWVDGESLAKIIRLANKRKKPLPLHLALRVMADACAGLHAAHELKSPEGELVNVVHRDVSPHNILVTGGGAAKVIDFGVAKAANRGAGDTQSGVVKGKIRYMAPEQVNSQGIDRRADLWAIGMCLHELVIGKPPFDDLGDVDVVRRLMTANPEPEIDDSHPKPLRKVLAKSLVRDPNARYPTAAAMKRGIEAALDEMGVSPTSEDVAEFIKEVIPELAEWRKRTVTKAITAAGARNSGAPDLRATERPTMRVSARDASSPSTEIKIESASAEDIEEVSLTRKKPAQRRGSTPPASAVTVSDRNVSTSPGRQVSDRPDRRDKTTGGATLTEQLGQRPRSRVPSIFGGAVVALALFATFVWPGVDRMRSLASSEAPRPSAVPSATTALPPPAPTPSASTIEIAEPPPSAIPSAAPRPTVANPIANPIPTNVAPQPTTRPHDPSQEPSDPAALAAAAAAAEAALRAQEAGAPQAPPPTAPPTNTAPAPTAPAPTATETPPPAP